MKQKNTQFCGSDDTLHSVQELITVRQVEKKATLLRRKMGSRVPCDQVGHQRGPIDQIFHRITGAQSYRCTSPCTVMQVVPAEKYYCLNYFINSTVCFHPFSHSSTTDAEL